VVSVDAVVLVDVVVVADASLVLVDDACFTHSIGDHEARATAVKVSVGGDPSQPLLPQHSQACVFWFHWIKVEPSSAVRTTS
jgi:hypothetical protein